MMLRTALTLILLLLALPVQAETVTPTAITGPLSFKAGSTEYVFDGLYAPPGNNDVLAGLINQPLEVKSTTADRWGRTRLTASITTELLRQGAVQLQPIERAPTAEDIAAEAEAQTARRGLWNSACCRMLEAAEAGKGMNAWRIVQGSVRQVTTQRDKTYVNFGDDWRTDFTVVIPARIARNLNAESWTGRNIEVRGYISWLFGPSITLSHAAQIRLPDAANP